jgi:toxin ParE1/3/4
LSRRLVILQSALDDLKDIYTYIADNADSDVADGYVVPIKRALANLGEFPFRGSPQDHLKAGLRSISFERRIKIFYFVGEDVVEVARAIHMSRDLNRIFGESAE